MGICGLLSYCMGRKQDCVEYVDLINIAQSRSGIELLVDFYSFEHLLLSKFWMSLSRVHSNNLLRLLGGEYEALHNYITKLVVDLQSLDIHLVMYIDGSKGSSKVGAQQKMDTWKARHHRDVGKLKTLLDVCCGRKQITDVGLDVAVRPVLLEAQVLETLRSCNCEVRQCTAGEADFILARDLQNRPKAYAILSNDSDFCVFRDCCFVPNQLFDLEDDLQLGAKQLVPERPSRLIVGVLSAQKVTEMLGLAGTAGMVELSMLAGNDFTGPHINRIRSELRLGNSKMLELAHWVKENGCLDNHALVRREMKRDRKLELSIHRSRDFYTLVQSVDTAELNSNVSFALDEGIKQGAYPASMFGMHKQFYWHRMLLEDCSYEHPCAEVALSDLRMYIYKIVLPPGEQLVEEYGRTPCKELGITTVRAVSDRRIPTVDRIQPNRDFQNLKTFHHIMMHYEPRVPMNYFDRYGRKMGFLCYTLRYFLNLTVNYTLCIDMVEFMPVVSMVFGCHDTAWYQGLNVRPTCRCVTIGNWYQDVYRHAYCFLAKLLHVSHEFPEPREVYSGSVFTVLYMVNTKQALLSREAVRRVHRDMDTIIREKRHMIGNIVQDFFPFSTRF